MKLTLARALKEKNRIAGRLHHVQDLVKKENRQWTSSGGLRRKTQGLNLHASILVP